MFNEELQDKYEKCSQEKKKKGYQKVTLKTTQMLKLVNIVKGRV